MRQEIYNVLFKKPKEVELSKMEVNLSLLGDLKKLEQDISKKAKEAYDNAKKVEADYQKVNDKNRRILAEAENELKVAFERLADARAQAKDLGLELPREFFDRYDTMKNFVSKIPVSNLGGIFPI